MSRGIHAQKDHLTACVVYAPAHLDPRSFCSLWPPAQPSVLPASQPVIPPQPASHTTLQRRDGHEARSPMSEAPIAPSRSNSTTASEYYPHPGHIPTPRMYPTGLPPQAQGQQGTAGTGEGVLLYLVCVCIRVPVVPGASLGCGSVYCGSAGCDYTTQPTAGDRWYGAAVHPMHKRPERHERRCLPVRPINRSPACTPASTPHTRGEGLHAAKFPVSPILCKTTVVLGLHSSPHRPNGIPGPGVSSIGPAVAGVGSSMQWCYGGWISFVSRRGGVEWKRVGSRVWSCGRAKS